MKLIFLSLLVLCPIVRVNAQRFDLGDKIEIDKTRFQLIGISSETNVHSYKYIGVIKGKMFERRIGDIIVGVKDGRVATTVYNLIPLRQDVGVPKSLIAAVQRAFPYPLGYKNGIYGANIDNETFSFSRTSSVLTFNKDRIMYYSSVKSSLLKN